MIAIAVILIGLGVVALAVATIINTRRLNKLFRRLRALENRRTLGDFGP